VALTGAAGQLGCALRRTAPDSIELRCYGRSELDLAAQDDIGPKLGQWRPELVINAAAYTAVDKAESDAAAAFQVNSVAVRSIAEALATSGGRLIHISTDFVFSGDVPVPHSPDAATNPVNAYGRSKLSGEQSALEVLPHRTLVVRTSWLYSRDGANFVKTMLYGMAHRDELRVVYDQVGTPTWTMSLADAIWRMASIPAMQGVHHFSDEGVASWYDFAVAIQEEALARNLLSRKVPIYPIRTRDYPTPARRPAYSVLDKSRTLASLKMAPRYWRESLRAMLDDLAAT
jgi:dTDP-4-dehydrorhamnose reductase